MLRLILGKAGAGKTAAGMREIRDAVQAKRGGNMLIVPEQYSHEAERELAKVCGDTMSLYAEVFSFTGFARRIMTVTGGAAAARLDKGGKLLCMSLALNAVASRLSVYGTACRRPETQAMLLQAADECKAACITPEALSDTAGQCSGGLRSKLEDLSLILGAYEGTVAATGSLDPSDLLTFIAENLPAAGFGPETSICIDGFTDFTGQELEVIYALLRQNVSLTVCLTLDTVKGGSELYSLTRRSAGKLLRRAEELGTPVKTEVLSEGTGKADAVRFLSEYLLGYTPAPFTGDSSCISLYTAGSMVTECEFAAAKVLSLVRDSGCRWRDIAIAVRGFDSYRSTLESMFRYYGIPLFVSSKDDLFTRPLPALISGLFEIARGRWNADDVLSMLGTGLTGLDTAECDLLGSYIYLWQLTARNWENDAEWSQPPEGLAKKPGWDSPEAVAARQETLQQINSLRHRFADPIRRYERRAKAAATAAGQAQALSAWFDDIQLPKRLQERSEQLRQDGRAALADEYLQLWDIVVSALEQCAAILGDTGMNSAEFGSFFTLMLSRYDVGTIPVSLDSVSAGDFDRMRRRNIRHLIVLGADDARLPQNTGSSGIFSSDERSQLAGMGLELGGGDEEIWREFMLVYNCISLPSDSLSLCWSANSSEGQPQRPSFVVKRAQDLFGLRPENIDPDRCRISAPGPALSLAAASFRGGSAAGAAAACHFAETDPERFRALVTAAEFHRGKLSADVSGRLYGTEPRLSASRIENFIKCHYAYFMDNGLRAEPCRPAVIEATDIGSFTHDILENTLRDVQAAGGFAEVSDEEVLAIGDKYIAKYIHEKYDDFNEKTERFVYLFRRHIGQIRSILTDTADELRRSSFRPVDFELDLTDTKNRIPLLHIRGTTGSLIVTGVVDRVDIWEHDGKTYLRVVDYKTGVKKFELDDIVYGKNLQMLLYLHVLRENGAARYGDRIVPAGIAYVPAKDPLLTFPSADVSDAEIDKKRSGEIRRIGIVLDDPEVKAAWETGSSRYIPQDKTTGNHTHETVLSAEHIDALEANMTQTVSAMADSLREGDIAANPYYRSGNQTACDYCEFSSVCRFVNGENGESYRYLPELKADEIWEKLEGDDKNG